MRRAQDPGWQGTKPLASSIETENPTVVSDASLPRENDARLNLSAHLGTIFTMFAWGTLIPVTGVVLREIEIGRASCRGRVYI